jgi:phosphoenolpyruvate-protein kinase (PTS system EI component)
MNPEERALLIAEITDAVKVIPTVLSDDEQRWVRLAIKKEAQSIAFRTAIIEKSLLGVVAMFGAGVIYIIADFLKNHGFR